MERQQSSAGNAQHHSTQRKRNSETQKHSTTATTDNKQGFEFKDNDRNAVLVVAIANTNTNSQPQQPPPPPITVTTMISMTITPTHIACLFLCAQSHFFLTLDESNWQSIAIGVYLLFLGVSWMAVEYHRNTKSGAKSPQKPIGALPKSSDFRQAIASSTSKRSPTSSSIKHDLVVTCFSLPAALLAFEKYISMIHLERNQECSHTVQRALGAALSCLIIYELTQRIVNKCLRSGILALVMMLFAARLFITFGLDVSFVIGVTLILFYSIVNSVDAKGIRIPLPHPNRFRFTDRNGDRAIRKASVQQQQIASASPHLKNSPTLSKQSNSHNIHSHGHHSPRDKAYMKTKSAFQEPAKIHLNQQPSSSHRSRSSTSVKVKSFHSQQQQQQPNQHTTAFSALEMKQQFKVRGFYSQLFGALPVGVAIISFEQDLLYASTQMLHMLNCQDEATALRIILNLSTNNTNLRSESEFQDSNRNRGREPTSSSLDEEQDLSCEEDGGAPDNNDNYDMNRKDVVLQKDESMYMNQMSPRIHSESNIKNTFQQTNCFSFNTERAPMNKQAHYEEEDEGHEQERNNEEELVDYVLSEDDNHAVLSSPTSSSYPPSNIVGSIINSVIKIENLHFEMPDYAQSTQNNNNRGNSFRNSQSLTSGAAGIAATVTDNPTSENRTEAQQKEVTVSNVLSDMLGKPYKQAIDSKKLSQQGATLIASGSHEYAPNSLIGTTSNKSQKYFSYQSKNLTKTQGNEELQSIQNSDPNSEDQPHLASATAAGCISGVAPPAATGAGASSSNKTKGFDQLFTQNNNVGYVQQEGNTSMMEIEYQGQQYILKIITNSVKIGGGGGGGDANESNKEQRVAIIVMERMWTEVVQKRVLHMIRQKMQIFGSLSHELRTPLNCSISMLEVLHNLSTQQNLIPPALSHQLQRYIQPALNQSKLLLNMINDILDFVQIENGSFKFCNVDFNLLDLLRDCVSLVSIEARMKKLTVNCYYDESTPKVIKSDPNRIRQVVLNFLSNALKFTVSGSIIVFATSTGKGVSEVQISVKDTGIGINQENLSVIFNVFNKIDLGERQKLNMQGCGVGLALSNNIARQLGPKDNHGIAVMSKKDSGSTFSFVVKNHNAEDNVLNEEDVFEEYSTLNQRQVANGSQQLIATGRQLNPKNERNMMTTSLPNEKGSPPLPLFPVLSDNTQQQLMNSRSGFNQTLRIVVPNSLTNLEMLPVSSNMSSSQNLLSGLTKRVSGGEKSSPVNESPAIGFSSYLEHPLNERDRRSLASMKSDMKHFGCGCTHVLLVDDAEFNLFALSEQLEQFYGIHSDKISHASAVNSLVKQKLRTSTCCRVYKLIFMDINMPEKNGYQVAKEILDIYTKDISKKHKARKYVSRRESANEKSDYDNGEEYDEADEGEIDDFLPSIIACSGFNGEEDKLKARDHGMVDFVTKPIMRQSLDAIVRKYYRISHPLAIAPSSNP